MKNWMWAALVATVVMTNLAPAAEPWNLPQLRGGPPVGSGLFPGVSARTAAWRQESPAPAPAQAPAPMPAIAGHGGIGLGSDPGNGSVAGGPVISQTAWNQAHVYNGYVYGPGSCSYTAPCVDHLWDGYCQRPLRCGGHHHGHRFNQCGGCGYSSGCSSCGMNYASCNSGCHGCRLHARHSGGCGCNTGCSTCGNACGCNFGHFGKHVRAKCCGWFNNLCNACDGGMSCGCATPVGSGPGTESIPAPAPDGANPAPVPDNGTSARKLLNRYMPWTLK